ncbi:XrtA system polysaccharide chain length determinant [Geoalkalibacter halelectricus]|uniref:Chain length-determining protein n=1 Tax=Geoalkalibacter halelectricus TaxID=2847045 RepID=A0ABY5ZNR2_9BACT|nr:XrtA system polysaccharide chain length determinant [Geoalkalibacter halelectricus]MDO3379698.1 chain length-determining protein [Geoalkalibacter halelectricus]UWZ79597.1 chain length-determining protein [Geoalkalibacter halelectricus]
MDNPLSQVKKYLFLVYKKRFIFLFSSLLVMSVIISGSFFMTKKYEASSTVFIERNMIDSLLRGITITPSMDDRIRVLRHYMLSRDLISRTLRKLDADLTAPTPEQFEGLIRKYQRATNINMRGQELFIVSLRDEDPVFARDFINALVGTYVEENIASKREEAFGAGRFISEQLTFFKQRLDEAQDRVIQFRRDREIYSTVSEAALLENIKRAEEGLEQIKMQKNEMLATIATIRRQLDMMAEFSAQNTSNPFGFAATGSGGNALVAQLESRRQEMLQVYNERHPEIVRLDARIEAILEAEKDNPVELAVAPVVEFNPLEDPIYVDLKMRLNARETEFQAIEARERELQAMIQENQAKLREFPEEKKLLADLERERNSYLKLYEQLLERQGVTEVSKQMEVADKTTTFRIVDPAVLPRAPVSIDRFKVMLLGVFVGFGAGLGLVILLEMIDGRFKDIDSLRQLGIPILAEIPTIPDPVKQARMKKFNIARYACAGCGFLVIGMFLAHDALGLGLIDRFIIDSNLDQVVAKVVRFIN